MCHPPQWPQSPVCDDSITQERRHTGSDSWPHRVPGTFSFCLNHHASTYLGLLIFLSDLFSSSLISASEYRVQLTSAVVEATDTFQEPPGSRGLSCHAFLMPHLSERPLGELRTWEPPKATCWPGIGRLGPRLFAGGLGRRHGGLAPTLLSPAFSAGAAC